MIKSYYMYVKDTSRSHQHLSIPSITTSPTTPPTKHHQLKHAPQKHRSNLQRRRPFVLQYIQAYSSQFIHIWVIYLRQKPNFRGCHWVILWQKQFQLIYAAFIGRRRRSKYNHIEISQILFTWRCTDSIHRFTNQPLCLFDDPTRKLSFLFLHCISSRLYQYVLWYKSCSCPKFLE